MQRIVFWILGLPAGVFLIAFALANRTVVQVSLDPVSTQNPWFAIALPVWAVLFTGIFIGLITGWLVAWAGQGKWRRAAREANTNLQRERSTRQSIEKKLHGSELAPLSGERINA